MSTTAIRGRLERHQIVPSNPAVPLGVLLVLLTPCIDYARLRYLTTGNFR
jgi:hypothetical protein